MSDRDKADMVVAVLGEAKGRLLAVDQVMHQRVVLNDLTRRASYLVTTVRPVKLDDDRLCDLMWDDIPTVIRWEEDSEMFRVGYACDDDECSQPHVIRYPSDQTAEMIDLLTEVFENVEAGVTDSHYLFH